MARSCRSTQTGIAVLEVRAAIRDDPNLTITDACALVGASRTINPETLRYSFYHHQGDADDKLRYGDHRCLLSAVEELTLVSLIHAFFAANVPLTRGGLANIVGHLLQEKGDNSHSKTSLLNIVARFLRRHKNVVSIRRAQALAGKRGALAITAETELWLDFMRKQWKDGATLNLRQDNIVNCDEIRFSCSNSGLAVIAPRGPVKVDVLAYRDPSVLSCLPFVSAKGEVLALLYVGKRTRRTRKGTSGNCDTILETVLPDACAESKFKDVSAYAITETGTLHFSLFSLFVIFFSSSLCSIFIFFVL